MKTILFFLFVSVSAFAIPEKDFPHVWKNEVLPFYDGLPKYSFQNSQGVKLQFSYLLKEENKRSIVIAPGRTEPAVKYAELVYDLKNSGFNIFVVDHQGQGETTRQLPDTNKGDVAKFQNYVSDFELYISKIKKLSDTPLYLIAHSMGGAITLRYMSANPETFEKAALMAPMLEMNTAPYSELVARLYSNFLSLTGKGKDYAPGYGPYNQDIDTFEANTVTHSEGRFFASKFLFTERPELAVGGPTARWVHGSLKATKKIDRLPFHTPVILFQAEQDVIVKPGRQNSFCRKNRCEVVLMKGAKHEILMEKDEIRDEALSKIKSFFNF